MGFVGNVGDTPLITNVDFPIAVATYLLIRFETKIDGLSKAITDLTNYKGDDKSAYMKESP